ncbi:MAG: hypothetical protein GY716_11260 [bacterium]|nr:hypothetical protein [bacterium]
MKRYVRTVSTSVLLLLLASVLLPSFGQEEESGGDGGDFGIFLEVGTWISQPLGGDYIVATQSDPNAVFDTTTISLDHSTTTEVRYRGGFTLPKGHGEFIATWYAHSEDDLAETDIRPGQFIFGESLVQGYAGYDDLGFSDSYFAEGNTSLRDLRLDYAREAFDTHRITGKWFVGYRRVQHNRDASAEYVAILPPGPQTPTPLPDEAFIKSSYTGRGFEGGLDVTMPLLADGKVTLESGLTLGILRGKTSTTYRSTTYEIGTQVPENVGLKDVSEDTSSQIVEGYLGVRWQVWRTLDLFGGFRTAAYDNIVLDLRPAGPGFPNPSTTSESWRSVDYEGFYAGISYLF